MSFLLATLVVLYCVRVPICIMLLFIYEKYELNDMGIRTPKDAIRFTVIPGGLFYIGYMHLKEKFENQ